MQKIIQRRTLPTTCHLPKDFHPVLKRVLAARHIDTFDELDYSLPRLQPYTLLKDIDKAVHLLYNALKQQMRILIIADYDADGATSCAVAVKTLKLMGAQHVNYLVPNREEHGYGLSEVLVKLALQSRPNLLITVDNGISSFSGVALAKQYGIQVLITDHHLPAKQLPSADAIVNPNQTGDLFPSKMLAGVGVIFYVMMALRAYLREQGWFSAQQLTEPNLANLLDLVALGTVADVVPLDYNNRILVDQGLRRIRAGQCCYGIQALLAAAKRDASQMTTTDLSFGIAPRLNAAGRMDDMRHGIACLLSENYNLAHEHAQLLEVFNHERRAVESDMQQEAENMLSIMTLEKQTDLPIGLCLYDENWHKGVIGLLASRIKERLARPVIVFTNAGNGQIVGSARSVAHVHIKNVLDSIAIQYPKIFIKYGGHAMAAGLTLHHHDFELFKTVFNHEVQQYISIEDLQNIVLSDGLLTDSDFTLNLASQLRTITPWGQGFAEPIFDGEFTILDKQLFKNKHLKMKVKPIEGSNIVEVMAFNLTETSWLNEIDQVKLAYKLDINSFRGFQNLCLTTECVIW